MSGAESRSTVRVVAALIADGKGGHLIQQRPEGKSRGSLWEFPGGKVEPGESDEAALVRECDEELGVGLEVFEQVAHTRHAYADLTVELALYRAEITRGTPAPLSAQALRFATFEQMRALPFCEADVPILERLSLGDSGG